MAGVDFLSEDFFIQGDSEFELAFDNTLNQDSCGQFCDFAHGQLSINLNPCLAAAKVVFMKVLRRLSLLGFLSILILSVASGQVQQHPAPAKAPAKPAPSTQPAPTIDTLLATDTYKVYGEVRGVGQLIGSNSINELLEPVMKLAAPPKELTTLVKWLKSHADGVMTSRMLVAGWPTAKNVPDLMVALEFSSADEAMKFAPQLNDFLTRVLPAPEGEKRASGVENKSQPGAQQTKATPSSRPNYYLKQVGSLLVITPTPLTVKNLRPPGSKLLTENPNFRTARDRFSGESIFVFVNVKGIEKEEEELRKQTEEEARKREAEAATQQPSPQTQTVADDSPETIPDTPVPKPSVETNNSPSGQSNAQVASETTTVNTNQNAASEEMSNALNGLAWSFFGGKSKWPEGIGIAVSLGSDSFDVRALLVNSPGEKSDPVPFVPLLIPGPAIAPESPSILPADTELFVMVSLDLPAMFTAMTRKTPYLFMTASGPMSAEVQSPFAQIEKKLGIKVKEDLLPLIGNEVVLSLPVKELGPGPAVPAPSPGTASAEAKSSMPSPSPIVAISLRDKEGMRALLPKIIDGLGFKGASALGQSERREDTEIVSYGNVLSYAFVGNFLVLATDTGAIHRVVDSYLKHETLSGDSHFTNYTRWQPRQLQGQVYVSPALMESYKNLANQPSSLISDQTREFLMRLSIIPQPVTYSLSNDGLGSLHELHVPKNLVLMAVAAISSETNRPPMVANEALTISALYAVASAEAEFKASSGAYATLDQLLSEKKLPKEIIENHGYKIDVMVIGDRFEVSAIPLEYGTTGKMSYFIDESNVVRGGDHGGSPATVADNPLH